MSEKILVVEDDKDIQELVSEILKSEGYKVLTAGNGLDGYQIYKEEKLDLLILDIMMPKMDGYQLAKLIRKKDEKLPIIMLTALEEEYDEIKGFEIGADDYITKPFSFNVLIRRVNALLKRTKTERKEIIYKNIKLDLESYTVIIDGKEIELTNKEFDILHYLMTNRNKVVLRQTLMDNIWGWNFKGDSRVLDTHIKNLRRKLQIDYIKTLKGVGYKFED
ncbi:MAG: response regulator transcription factor [Firmicutes bacterium]|nr:response regulator transcription factor [Bacillota bacterium]